MEEPGADERRRVDRDGDAEGESADTSPETQHVQVRRAERPQSVFGETPIARPAGGAGAPQLENQADEEEEETGPETAAWIRRAALVAALRSGAAACGAGVFMGLCLGCFLPGSIAILLGMLMAVLSVPVGLFAGYTTYRQTIETERTRQGLCPNCGYDLRGINTERCPECGTRVRARPRWLQQPERPEEDEEG